MVKNPAHTLSSSGRSKRGGQKRPSDALERRKSSTSPRGKILISSDRRAGSYFSDMTQHLGISDRVMLHTCQTQNPVTIVENAFKVFKKKWPFQRIYALVCWEGKEDLCLQARALVFNHNLGDNVVFRLVTSTPTFDLWLLLHGVGTSLDYGDGHTLLACIQKQLEQPRPLAYLGEGAGLFELLRPGLPDAIRGGQMLSCLKMTTGNAPVTEVHELVSYLLKWHSRLQYFSGAL